jgi:hypothetical protein
MSSSDFCAMLGDTCSNPAIWLLCMFFTFVAGILAGLLARGRINEENECDAGDTHSSVAWLNAAARSPIARSTPAAPPTTAARPRIRAIGSDTLKPSYDARKAPSRQ